MLKTVTSRFFEWSWLSAFITLRHIFLPFQITFKTPNWAQAEVEAYMSSVGFKKVMWQVISIFSYILNFVFGSNDSSSLVFLYTDFCGFAVQWRQTSNGIVVFGSWRLRGSKHWIYQHAVSEESACLLHIGRSGGQLWLPQHLCCVRNDRTFQSSAMRISAHGVQSNV